MTTTIRILLTNASAGTWTTDDGDLVADGIKLLDNRDGEILSGSFEAPLRSWLAKQPQDLRDDGLVILVDPLGTDFAGQPVVGGEELCQFRLRAGRLQAAW